MVWDGSQYVEAGLAGAEHAYVWDGTGYNEVWANYVPVEVSVAIPQQTTTTESSYVLTSLTVPGPVGESRDCQVRLTVNWGNRASGQSYRVAFFVDGVQQNSWESAPSGTGAYSQVLEMGYDTHPYPYTISVACGSLFEVCAWVSAPDAANRLVNASSLVIQEV